MAVAVALTVFTSPAVAEPRARPFGNVNVARDADGTAAAPTMRRGVAVVAVAGATDVAWPLAQALYGDARLRPAAIDEARARILCGERPAPNAPPELRDLAATVAAVTGDDAPSRALLASIGARLGVRALAVVAPGGGTDPAAHDAAVVRVFVVETGAFDAATYAPDRAAPGGAWSGVVGSLDRTFGLPPPEAPSLATHEVPGAHASGRPFYVSPWFWGAVGLAALGGTAAWLVSRDTGAKAIHLQVQVPQQ